MDLDLTDRVIVVTGASKGIGLATAEELLIEGARVVLLARDTNRLNFISERLKTSYDASRFFVISVDCGDETSLKNASMDIEREFGQVFSVIANIGDGQSVKDPIPEMDHWTANWRTNFETALVTARVFAPILAAQEGSFVFVSSIAGIESIGAPTDYSTAKAALIAFAKNLSVKLAPNVRVNVVAPGNILVPGGAWDSRLQNDPESISNMIRLTVPLNRFGNPHEIADAIMFLCSPRSAFTTGSVFRVDGGQTVSIQI
jgi:3-oxoacyl-[acyl-carrier protein] reductase